MTKRYLVAAGAVAPVAMLVMLCATPLQAQQLKGDVRTAKPISQSDLPEKMRPEAKIVKGYVPPKTVWGDPQISGAYTNLSLIHI